jgi:GNAT superfamily N-acetyltransferase
MNKELKIVRLKGSEIIPYVSDLAKLRIEIFKTYPYLYLGDLEQEAAYLQTYVKCSESVMVLVLDENKVVGASTAIPLEYETAEIQKPFLDHNIKIQEVFYLGESVLRPTYRGRNIYRHFFHERESAAREYGAKTTTFAAIERALDDPRRPQNYVPLDNIWEHFGYKKNPELVAYFEWQEIDEAVRSPKPLIFWLKALSDE